MHGDLCGPVTLATPRGRCYFLLLVNDLSRYMWVVVLGSKGEDTDAIRRVQAAAEVECDRKLHVLRTDNDGEFTTAKFTSYCTDEGVQRHYFVPYSPEQNGSMAVYILNRSPTKALNGRTSYEAWHGRKPAVSHLRVFDCLTFANELSHIGKLDDRSTPGVFISYAEGSKGLPHS
jgi:hypothetical protein